MRAQPINLTPRQLKRITGVPPFETINAVASASGPEN
jgi:hypothetical protein